MIHPTAIVDPSAQLGEGVEVGPYCVIEANVVLGAGCMLRSHVTIGANTKAGSENTFFPFASVGQRSKGTSPCLNSGLKIALRAPLPSTSATDST